MAGAGYPTWAAVAGALLASFAVVLLPVALVLLVGHWLLSHREHAVVASVLRCLRLAVVGLIAAATIGLMTAENFGLPGLKKQFLLSAGLFAAVFVLNYKWKVNPIVLILLSGLAGVLFY